MLLSRDQLRATWIATRMRLSVFKKKERGEIRKRAATGMHTKPRGSLPRGLA